MQPRDRALPGLHKALGPIPSTTKKRKEKVCHKEGSCKCKSGPRRAPHSRKGRQRTQPIISSFENEFPPSALHFLCSIGCYNLYK